MNNPLNTNQQPIPPMGQVPPPPAQPAWSPQVSSPASMPMSPVSPVSPPVSASIPVSNIPSSPVANSQFDSSGAMPNLTGPTSAPMGQESMTMEPETKRSPWLFIILAIIVVIAGVVMASWLGWLDFGKLFGTKETVTTANGVTVAETPVTNVNQNDATRKKDLANLKTALNKYYNDKQSYPLSASLSKTSDTDSPLKVLVPNYIEALPLDPLAPTGFYGYKSVDGKGFELTAVLEDKTDLSGITVGNLYIYKVTDTSVEAPISTTDNSSDLNLEPSATDIQDSNTGGSTSSTSQSSTTTDGSSASASVQ